jgi:hypothetical protein
LKPFARQWLPWALGLWAVGVQVHELLATVGAWLTFALTLPLLERRDAKTWAAVGGLVAWCLVVPTLGHFPTGTGVARALDFLLIPAAAIAVSSLDGAALTRVGYAAATALVVSTVVAGLQHVGFWPGLATLEPLAWTHLPFSRVYETVPGRDDRFMAGGLLLHRLKFANVTAVACVVGAYVVQRRVPSWRLFAVATLVGLVGVSIFPHARAASVAVVLSMAVVWVAAAANRVRAALGALALVGLSAGLVLVSPSVRARFEQSWSSEGSGERRSITQGGLNAIASAPVGGVGLGRFRPGLFLPDDAPAQAREHPGKAHDQFITLAAEAGLPAAAWLIALLVTWLVLGLRRLPGGALLVGGVTLFALLGLLHDPLFHAESSFALMLLLGAGLGALRRLQVSAGEASRTVVG